MAKASAITIIGAGNVGSFLIPQLARLPEVGRLTIIDRDSYGPENLTAQNITPADLGQPKAEVLARQARAVREDLQAEAIVGDLEELSVGLLAADLLVTALDNRRARMRVNECARWLGGLPWIDTGVATDGLLARVTVFSSSADGPCYECGFSPRDYQLVETSYACPAGAVAPTRGIAALGALTAALAVLKCRQLLRGDSALQDHELVYDAATHRVTTLALRRNPDCRIDHRSVRPRVLSFADAQVMTLHELLAMARREGMSGDLAVQVAGHRLCREMVCEQCRAASVRLRVARPAWRCACGGTLRPLGISLWDSLAATALCPEEAGLTLAALGVDTGDLLFITGAADRRAFLVGGE